MTAILIIWLTYGDVRPIVVGRFPVAVCESMAEGWRSKGGGIQGTLRKARCLVITDG